MAPQWPPGCPLSEVLTGSCLSADENIHGREYLKGKRRLAQIHLKSPGVKLPGREAGTQRQDPFLLLLLLFNKKGTEGVASVHTMSGADENTVAHVSITLKYLG